MENKDTVTQIKLLMGFSSMKLQKLVKACNKTIMGLQLSNHGVGAKFFRCNNKSNG